MADWSRVTALFQRVLERAPAAREEFLVDACDGDEALAAEIRSLLAAHDSAGGFLDRPAVLDESSAIDWVRDALGGEGSQTGAGDAGLDGNTGRTIGPYRIDAVVGRGGMGIVYLATDTRLHRQVALKALPPAVAADERRRERLRREARAAAALSHPGIATVYALEEAGDEIFIATEFVPGPTLRSRLADGRLTVDEAIRIGMSVAGALDTAHQRGVIHRDLKPENVIIGTDGRVKVLDFGIAFVTGAADWEQARPRLTETGAVLGTPAYMSPEQIEGRALDFRSDLFSFGTLLYEMISGGNPFDAPTPLASAARVAAADPVRLEVIDPAVPAELAAVVRRCLAKRPEDRYAKTSDLLGDLARLAAGRAASRAEPAEGGDSGTLPPNPWAERWWMIHQMVILPVYALMISLVWVVRGWLATSLAGPVLVLLAASAVVNGIIRVNLAFTARFNPGVVPAHIVRSRRYLVATDGAMAGGVLLAAANLMMGNHVGWALWGTALAIGVAVVSAWVEPATIEAAFPGVLPKPRPLPPTPPSSSDDAGRRHEDR